MKERILLVDDNEDLPQLIAPHIEEMNFELDYAPDGEAGLRKALSNDYVLIILDWVLPKMEGVEVCRKIRAEREGVPIIMLTSKAAEVDRVLGLELGADDYVTKPFSPVELKARIKAILRRTREAPESKRLVFGDLVLNLSSRTLTRAGEEIELTATQFDILVVLASHPHKAFSRDELTLGVFGHDVAGFEHSIATHINRIRAKLELDPANPKYVQTVRGVGYRFVIPESTSSEE